MPIFNGATRAGGNGAAAVNQKREERATTSGAPMRLRQTLRRRSDGRPRGGAARGTTPPRRETNATAAPNAPQTTAQAGAQAREPMAKTARTRQAQPPKTNHSKAPYEQKPKRHVLHWERTFLTLLGAKKQAGARDVTGQKKRPQAFFFPWHGSCVPPGSDGSLWFLFIRSFAVVSRVLASVVFWSFWPLVSWPVPLSHTCFAFGVAVAFASPCGIVPLVVPLLWCRAPSSEGLPQPSRVTVLC